MVILSDESKPKEVEILSDKGEGKLSETVKPKKTRKTKKNKTIDTKQTVVLICTVSKVFSCRPDCEQWAISEIEAEQIALPLLKIIEENEKLKEVGKYGDYIALLVACTVVTFPRIMITLDKNKTKKRGVIKNGIQQNNGQDGKVSNSDTPRTNINATNGADNVSNIHKSIIPITNGF